MAKIKVKAAPGMKFPMQHNAKKYITGESVEVESSAYYRRAITDGDLILVTDEKSDTLTPASGEVQAAAETKPAEPAQNKANKKAAPNE